MSLRRLSGRFACFNFFFSLMQCYVSLKIMLSCIESIGSFLFLLEFFLSSVALYKSWDIILLYVQHFAFPRKKNRDKNSFVE
jgi:hypothetical protein